MLFYIHIPFCDSKCHYCAFNSYVDRFYLKKQYMQALQKQLLFEIDNLQISSGSIESVFIGGGTPSTVHPELYRELFETLSPYLQVDAEITAEANPNSATNKWLEGMYQLGINRISFGTQTFDEKKLKLLNRAHSPSDTIRAIENAHSIGFEHLSVDLIYATLGDTKDLLRHDLQQAFALPIDHLSAYALTIEPSTHFMEKPHMAKEELELTQWLFDEIQNHGFLQYEISNFGIYQSKHNLGYWQYKDYVGLGSGAVGKYENKRFYPSEDLEAYINNPLFREEEVLDASDMQNEKIFLGMRSCVGIEEQILTKDEQFQTDILLEEGKISSKNGIFYNNDYLLADEIALFISS